MTMIVSTDKQLITYASIAIERECFLKLLEEHIPELKIRSDQMFSGDECISRYKYRDVTFLEFRYDLTGHGVLGIKVFLKGLSEELDYYFYSIPWNRTTESFSKSNIIQVFETIISLIKNYY